MQESKKAGVMSSDGLVSIPEAPTPPSPEYLAESLSPVISCVTWVSVAVPLLFVLLRIYSRIFLRKVFGIDDGLIVVAMILLVAYGAVIQAALQKGLGGHIEWVLLEAARNATPIALLGQVSQPLVIMSCAFGKNSISATLLRVGSQRWVKIAVWFIIVAMNIGHVLVSILLFLRCEDPRFLWDPSIDTTCWPIQVFLYVVYCIGSYSAATDFDLALLPWAILWNLNMKKKDMFGVAFAMSLGILAGGTAIVKCTKLSANSTSTDPTYDVGELLWWAGAENALIVVAACLPTLRPLVCAVIKSTAKSSGDSDSHAMKNLSNQKRELQPRVVLGQWTALVESKMTQDHASNDDSDKSILRQNDKSVLEIGQAVGRTASPEESRCFPE